MLNGYYNKSVIRPVVFNELATYDQSMYHSLKDQHSEDEVVLVEFNSVGTITDVSPLASKGNKTRNVL